MFPINLFCYYAVTKFPLVHTSILSLLPDNVRPPTLFFFKIILANLVPLILEEMCQFLQKKQANTLVVFSLSLWISLQEWIY